jgi:hypothetical protein
LRFRSTATGEIDLVSAGGSPICSKQLVKSFGPIGVGQAAGDEHVAPGPSRVDSSTTFCSRIKVVVGVGVGVGDGDGENALSILVAGHEAWSWPTTRWWSSGSPGGS